MTFAESLKAVAEHNAPVRFRVDDRKRVIRSLDVATGRIVAEFPLKRGVDGHAVLPKIIGLLLESGQCEIHAVDGEDVESPLVVDIPEEE
jgi:hypothetical protein